MTKGNLLIGQSGGPTAVINASLCGVIDAALNTPQINHIYGAVNGIEGVMSENFVSLSSRFKDEDNRKLLKHTPGAFLGSCRYKLPDAEKEPQIYEKIFSVFQKHNISIFLYIGGNDSMDTVYKLSTYAKKHSYDISIVGVPKTIDNDLCLTDHCPGYGSAAKMIASTIKEVACDCSSYDIESVTIIEIMGRNAGWLTAAAALARQDGCTHPDLIYLPEVPFSMEEFIKDAANLVKDRKNIVVAVSEGIRDKDGNYICDSVSFGETDKFGHKMLNGCAMVLRDALLKALGCKVRSVELNLPQRCASHIASATDVTEAFEIGASAVKAALSGLTGHMMAYIRKSNSPYEIAIEPMDISKIANVEHIVPPSMISPSGNDVTEEFIAYALPLIKGEVFPIFEEGVPRHIRL